MIVITPSDWQKQESNSQPVSTQYRVDYMRGPIKFVLVEQSTNVTSDVPWRFRTDRHKDEQDYATAEEAMVAAAAYCAKL
jgi:hypothetical protein